MYANASEVAAHPNAMIAAHLPLLFSLMEYSSSNVNEPPSALLARIISSSESPVSITNSLPSAGRSSFNGERFESDSNGGGVVDMASVRIGPMVLRRSVFI